MGTFIPTRSHCEDRLSCAVALKSGNEFKHWLTLYVRVLATAGNEEFLRILFDLIQGERENGPDASPELWWLASASVVLGLNRTELLKTVAIPEISRNPSLQRLRNELVTELNM